MLQLDVEYFVNFTKNQKLMEHTSKLMSLVGHIKKRQDISENLMIFQWLVWLSESTHECERKHHTNSKDNSKQVWIWNV